MFARRAGLHFFYFQKKEAKNVNPEEGLRLNLHWLSKIFLYGLTICRRFAVVNQIKVFEQLKLMEIRYGNFLTLIFNGQ
jgi:hypothetical protein